MPEAYRSGHEKASSLLNLYFRALRLPFWQPVLISCHFGRESFYTHFVGGKGNSYPSEFSHTVKQKATLLDFVNPGGSQSANRVRVLVYCITHPISVGSLFVFDLTSACTPRLFFTLVLKGRFATVGSTGHSSSSRFGGCYCLTATLPLLPVLHCPRGSCVPSCRLLQYSLALAGCPREHRFSYRQAEYLHTA